MSRTHLMNRINDRYRRILNTTSAPVGDPDPDFADVELLLSMTGEDADTDVTDHSNSAHSGTTYGNAQIDSDITAFVGSNSLLLDGTGDYVTFPDNAAFEIGTQDFTIECWVRFNGDPGTGNVGFISKWDTFGADNASWLFGLWANDLMFFLTTNGTSGISFDKAWNPATATWYHVAVCRSGGDIYHFVDGTQLGTEEASTHNISDETSQIEIGAVATAAGDPANFLNGNIQDCRLTIGTGRYTENFTRPAVAFSAF